MCRHQSLCVLDTHHAHCTLEHLTVMVTTLVLNLSSQPHCHSAICLSHHPPLQLFSIHCLTIHPFTHHPCLTHPSSMPSLTPSSMPHPHIIIHASLTHHPCLTHPSSMPHSPIIHAFTHPSSMPHSPIIHAFTHSSSMPSLTPSSMPSLTPSSMPHSHIIHAFTHPSSMPSLTPSSMPSLTPSSMPHSHIIHPFAHSVSFPSLIPPTAHLLHCFLIPQWVQHFLQHHLWAAHSLSPIQQPDKQWHSVACQHLLMQPDGVQHHQQLTSFHQLEVQFRVPI